MEDKRRAIAFDATLLNALQRCPRMFMHQYIQNLRLIGENPEPLHRGILIHHFAEEYNKMKFAHRARHPHMIWAELEPKLTLDLLQKLELYALTPEDYYWILECFKEYTLKEVHYSVSSLPEQTVSKIIFEDEDYLVFWTGKIDIRVNGPGMDNVPLDYKSEKRRFEPDKKDNQFCGYAFVTDSTDLAVQKISLQETKKYRTHPFFHFSWAPGEIDEWVDNTIGVIKQYIFFRDSKWFPQHRVSCRAFNRPCSFTKLCESGTPQEKKRAARANYVIGEPWDILQAKRKEEKNG